VHDDTAHGPLDGFLVLPQSFGSIFLGETFSAYVSLANFSAQPAKAVGLKCELQSETGRVILFETPAPVPVLEAGHRRDVVLEHDLKEPGAHTLVCSAVYTDTAGERRYLPQYFRFNVAQPLSVRTKVRPLPGAGGVLLEASVENLTDGAMHVEGISCEAAPGMVAVDMSAPVEDSSLCLWSAATGAGVHPAGPLTPMLGRQRVLSGHGSAMHAVFHLQRGGTSPTDSAALPGSGGIIAAASLPSPPGALGKLEIRWRGRFGDGGRLQTQTIQVPAAAVPALRAPHTALSVSIAAVPARVTMHAPFNITVRVHNGTGARTAPLLIKASLSGSASATANGGGAQHSHQLSNSGISISPFAQQSTSAALLPLAFGSGIVLDAGGQSTFTVGELAPGAEHDVAVPCLPMALGVCRLPIVQLLEEPRVGVGQPRVVETAPALDVLVIQ
jgi:trafficking protein particle complex subunit 13